jgi:hypothetical protein
MRSRSVWALLVVGVNCNSAIGQTTPRDDPLAFKLPRFRFLPRDKQYFQLAPTTIDESKIPALIEKLKSKDDGQRHEAAGILGFTKEKGKAAIPILIEMLKDSNAMNRAVAANALANFGPLAREAVPSLTKLLKSEPGMEMMMALYAFEQMGPAAKAAIPDIIEIADLFPGSCKSMGVSSHETLNAIGPDVLPVAIKCLDDPIARRRANGASIAAGYAFEDRQLAEKLFPKFLNMMKDDDVGVRIGAIGAVAAIRQQPKLAIPALIDMLADKGDGVSLSAAMALGSFGGDAKQALPHLIRKWETADRYYRSTLVYVLAEVGPDKTAVGPLIRALDDDWTRYQAIIALGRIGPDAKAAVPHLVRLWQEVNDTHRMSIHEALRRIDPDAARKLGAPIP